VPGVAAEGLCRVNTLEFFYFGAVGVDFRINQVVACEEVRYDGLLPLRCLVEAAVGASPKGGEEAREHSVDCLFHCDAEELGIEADLVLEGAMCGLPAIVREHRSAEGISVQADPEVCVADA